MKLNWIKILAIVFFFYSLSILLTGVNELKETIRNIPIGFYCLSLIFISIGQFTLSLRWNYILYKIGTNIGYIKNLKIYIAGLSFIAAPARSGEAIRSYWLLKRHNIALEVGIFATIFERIIDLLSAVILIFLALNKEIYIFYFILFYIFFLKISSNELYNKSVYLYIKKFGNLFINKKIRNSKFFIKIIEIAKKCSFYKKYINKPKPILISLILCSITWLMESLILFLTFYYLDAGITFKESLIIRTLMGIGGAISFLPAGLITSESTGIGLALAFGSSQAEAITATFLVRTYTLLIPCVVGFSTLLLQKDLNSTLSTNYQSLK